MQNEKGYIKKTIELYINTNLGDRWKNTQDCEFKELKNGGYVVDEKSE